jgi:hypothetical protein
MVLVQACVVSCLTFGSAAVFRDTGSSDLTFPLPPLVAVQATNRCSAALDFAVFTCDKKHASLPPLHCIICY